MGKKVIMIPPTREKSPEESFMSVGIYCRVSSAKKAQLRSIAAQLSGLTKLVASHLNWRLVDIYMDIAPGKDYNRDQFNRMLNDAAAGRIDLVVVKHSSRLGRDTKEVIQACRDLANSGCEVYFRNYDSYYSKVGAQTIEINAAVDQAENEDRSDNIRWGIRRSLNNTDSKIYNKKLYGYEHDEEGNLVIQEEQAAIVRKIFSLYVSGSSVLSIKRQLEAERIPAPRGGNTWAKKTIDSILCNQKYVGSAIVLSSGIKNGSNKLYMNTDKDLYHYIEDHHPAIISQEFFEEALRTRAERSNIIREEDGTVTRKSTHYSSKRANETT